jgi:flagellar hook-basal body complex protein FliE
MAGLSPLDAVGGAGGFAGAAVTGVTGVSGPGATGATSLVGKVDGSGEGFASTLLSSLENVQALQANSSNLAIKAATGDLTDVHDYTIASTQAKVATEVTVAIRNKGLEAFNEIMRMQV